MNFKEGLFRRKKPERNIYSELKQVQETIEGWYFGYYYALELPKDYMELLNNLCEKEYNLAVMLYGDAAIKLNFNNLSRYYLIDDKKLLWWVMWGLSIYR